MSEKKTETTLSGMFLAVNSLLLTLLAKIGVCFLLLTRQVEPLPQLIDHESRTPALIAVNIAPCPWTSHSEILPGDFSVPTLVRSVTFMEIMVAHCMNLARVLSLWHIVFVK